MTAPAISERYEVRRLIARGGMGAVYEAYDHRLERPVAVKLLDAAGAAPERFIDELRALSATSHANVVRVYDAGTADGRPYLVMELVDGRSLRDLLADGPLEGAQLAAIGAAVASALASAHARGIVHSDIKPANILLDGDSRPRLADFGVARFAGTSSATVTEATWGTAAYLAPEQVSGSPVGPAADIYSLGLVLLEGLTGRKEYPGRAVEAAVARLARDPDIPTDLDAPWPALLRRMVDRDPQQRPSAEAVAQWLSGTRIDATAELDGADLRRAAPLGHRLLIGAAAAVALALAFSLAAAAARQPAPHPAPVDATISPALDDASTDPLPPIVELPPAVPAAPPDAGPAEPPGRRSGGPPADGIGQGNGKGRGKAQGIGPDRG